MTYFNIVVHAYIDVPGQIIVPKKTTSKLKTRTVQGTGLQGTSMKSGELVIIVLACKITIIVVAVNFAIASLVLEQLMYLCIYVCR